jgi:hypothetical protein
MWSEEKKRVNGRKELGRPTFSLVSPFSCALEEPLKQSPWRSLKVEDEHLEGALGEDKEVNLK